MIFACSRASFKSAGRYDLMFQLLFKDLKDKMANYCLNIHDFTITGYQTVATNDVVLYEISIIKEEDDRFQRQKAFL